MRAILLTTGRDSANVGYDLSHSLRSVGVNATMYSGKKVAHNYRKQGKVFSSISEIKSEINNSDIIIFMHGSYIDLKLDFSSKLVAVFQGGSNYRGGFKYLNSLFNPIVNVSLIQTGDLLGLGAKNEKWIAGCVDTNSITPLFADKPLKLQFAHFPSIPSKKGTSLLDNILGNLDSISFLCDSNLVDWENHLQRISKCDVYVEQFIQKQNKLPLCSFGISALEGAALGKIVLTNFCYLDKYEKEYGLCGLQIANNKEQLIQKVNELVSVSDKEWMMLQEESRNWVEEFHSYKAIGKRLLKAFGL